MSTATISLLLAGIPVGALLLTFVLLYPGAKRRKKALLEDFRRRTDAHYRAFRIVSRDPRFVFDPATATLVTEEEAFFVRRHSAVWEYAVTRYLRNPAGEYFRVTANPDGVTGHGHLEHSIARIVLKDRYEVATSPRGHTCHRSRSQRPPDGSGR
jgi:hypothetical protein